MKFAFRHHDHHHHGLGGVIVPTDHPSALLVIDAHGRTSNHDHRSSEPHGEYSSRALDASRHHGERLRPPSPSPPAVAIGVSCASALKDSAAIRHFESHDSLQFENDYGPSSDDPADCPYGGPQGGADGSSPTSKRALHLENHESECPVSNPDPASRPRSRQFFRLGRNRYRAIDRHPCAGCPSSDSSEDEGQGPIGERPRRTRRRGIGGLRRPSLRRGQSLPVGLAGSAHAAVDDRATTTTASLSTEAPGNDWLSQSERVKPSKCITYAQSDRLRLSERASRARGHRRHVTFTCVHIREYSTILGDHPCCPSGPPLSLGWTLEREDSIEFEEYERVRVPRRAQTKGGIKLSGDARRDILSGLLVAPPAAASEVGCGSSSSDEGEPTRVYSSRELRMAERRLMRDRAGSNSRQHRKMNDRFFSKPLSPEQAVGGGVVADLADKEEHIDDTEETGGTSMDISPVKPHSHERVVTMEDDAEDKRALPC